MEKELAEIVIDTPPIILPEVSQKSFIQSTIKCVNTGPSRGTAQRGRGGSPSSKYKEEKEGRQKEAKEKGELSFLQQYDAFLSFALRGDVALFYFIIMKILNVFYRLIPRQSQLQ